MLWPNFAPLLDVMHHSSAMKHAALLLVPLVLALASACAARGAKAEPDIDPATRPFAGTEWRLVEVGGQAAIPGSGTRFAFLSFDAEASSVRGHSGVNSFFGPYALDGKSLRVENLALTRMAGSPELMQQESAFTSAIQAARSYRIAAEELQLFDGTGATLARLLAQPD